MGDNYDRMVKAKDQAFHSLGRLDCDLTGALNLLTEFEVKIARLQAENAQLVEALELTEWGSPDLGDAIGANLLGEVECTKPEGER